MKRTLALILITGLVLSITGCAEQTKVAEIQEIVTVKVDLPVTESAITEKIEPPPKTELPKTTEPTKTEETEPPKPPKTDRTDKQSDTENPTSGFHIDSFETVEEFIEFAKNDRRLKGRKFLVPRVSLDGFKLYSAQYWEGGTIFLEYSLKNYVYDDSLSEFDNLALSKAHYVEAPLPEGRAEALTRGGFKAVTINGIEMHYREIRGDSNKTVLRYEFDFILGDKHIRIRLPAPAVRGLSVRNMGRFLEMVEVDTSQ